MKKLLMSLAVAAMAITVNAQVYLGGTVGLASVGHENGSDVTTFKILPEIGYNLNKSWAIGTVVGYQKGTFSMMDQTIANMDGFKGFTIAPYARYTFLHSKVVNMFIDLGFNYTAGEVDDVDVDVVGIGLHPGIAINLNQHFAVVGKIGFFGYENINPEGDNNNTHAFGLDLNGNNISLGLYYNF